MNIPTLGEELRRLRKCGNWTIYEISKQIGTSASLISLYETGKAVISEENLQKLADIYRVDFEYLHFLSLPIAGVYKEIIAESPKASAAIHRGLHIRPQLGEVRLLQKLFENMTTVDAEQHRWYETFIQQLTALNLPQPLSLWVRYYQALLAYGMEQPEQGTTLLEKLYEETGPAKAPKVPDLWMRVAQWLGREHFKRGRYSAAIPYLHAGEAFFSDERDFAGLTLVKVQLAELCEETGDERSMQGYFKAALGAVGDARNQFYAHVRHHYGAVYARRHHWDDAEVALSQALEVWQQLNRTQEQVETHLILSDIYREQKRWVKAQRELDAARSVVSHQMVPNRLVLSGKIDCAQARLNWDKGDRLQAMGQYLQTAALYQQLTAKYRSARSIAEQADRLIAEASAETGEWSTVLSQVRGLLEKTPLTCPKDAHIQGELLHLLLPALDNPDITTDIQGLLAETKAKLSEDNLEHAPLWAIVSCMESHIALRSQAWKALVVWTRTAVRWALDSEAVAIRRNVLNTLTEQLRELSEHQPDVAATVFRELKHLLDEHPHPRHRHQREHVLDWFVRIRGFVEP